ncbi:C-myc promoter-binding protein-like [Argiope bruennichi]|uniref:C-myc promoter-binding protein-like n=1 Tax=Argiope bruennichi TaxID=94029 RepID=UPI0024947DAC|nr:C-myc promoter-binding protein-like [Argiope bruennichi]
MDDKRVADYFVVAGLQDNASPLDESSRDGITPKTTHPLVPITDVTVIIRSQGETIPKGFTCIEYTPSNFPADLNHGSIRSPNIYFCYRRGRDKPPLVDVGVLYDGKEKIMADSEVVLTTPYGRSANVNNSGSKTFITYRRAHENAPCNQLVVTDICIILANKGENPPHAFCKIDKNLNKGVVGSDVFLCYKKSMNRPDLLSYKPGILGRFPLDDYENFALPPSVPLFCLPMGANIECWPKKAQQPKPVFSTFVLTSYSAEKVYGAAVTFYELFPELKLNKAMKSHLNYVTEEDKKKKCLQTNKSICLLSRWPFFDTFEKFLRYLHRMSISGPHKVPLERIISHFMLEVPFPSVQRPRILIQLADYTITLAQPGDTQLPLTGASFIQLLKNLGPDNCLKILLFALTEQKILFHSLRPDVLTSVAEAVVNLIFPFHWQCPYIPLCPLGLSDVLCAPVPFLVGVDSRYFDLYDPPHDVTCIDLDTNTFLISEEKRHLNTKLFPKRPARILRNTLQTLYGKLVSTRCSSNSSLLLASNSAQIDYDFKAKKNERQLELEIQEAFLRFMASILKGYRQYLLPITTAPTIGTTDPNSLFDLTGFLRSRDKAYGRFFSLVMKTQMFIRFIEERSFVSDKDASLAFFDECTEKIDSSDSSDSKFLEIDESQTSDRTVFVAPPEPVGLPVGLEYRYKQFGVLKPQLFHKNPAKSLLNLIAQASPMPNSPMARRSKQEIRSAQKIARKHSETPVMWAKCLVGYCVSLWFIHLPSFAKSSPSKSNALRLAFDVLVQIQKYKICQPDEVCYRVLMLLCGLYSQPTLAVKVLFEMKRHGVQPNAITYGYYNKAVLESKWPAADTSSTLMWNRLRNVIMGIAQFRQGLKNKARRSLSLCSESELDRLSRTSTESSNPDDITVVRIGNPAEFVPELIKLSDDQNNSDELSDRGYSSMNHVDGIKPSPVSEIETDNGIKKLNSEPPPTSDCDNQKCVGVKCPVARRLKFQEIDFSASDDFRSRVGSIVKSSASSIGSLSQLQECAVDSSAGILMTSRTSLVDEIRISDWEPETRKRHKSAGDCNCHSSCYLRSPNKPLNEVTEESTLKTPFFRSYSFGNDAQIIRKIRAAKDPCEPLAKWIESPLKKGLFDKKREDKEKVSKNCGLTRCDEEPETEQDVPGTLHAIKLLRPKSPCIPIEKQRKISEESKHSVISSLSSEDGSTSSAADDKNTDENLSTSSQDFLSSTFTPIKEAWLNWDFANSAIPRVASNITTTFGNVYRESFRRKQGNKVARSSTFHSGARNSVPKLKPRKEGLAKLSSDDVGNKSMSRSSTLPISPKVSHSSESDLTGSPFGISRLTGRHSEVLFDSLKSAVTSVSSKLNEFRSSLSATNTPTKNAFSSSSQHDIDLILYDDGELGGLTYDGYRISMDCANLNDISCSVFTPDHGRERTPGRFDHRGSLPHVVSAPVFSSQVFEMFEKQNLASNDGSGTQKIAIDITMTTCSRCFTCSSLLYDEEIMEGWSADESNLNTQCTFCKAKLVPLLSIFIEDFRWNGVDENDTNSLRSADSLGSISPNSNPDTLANRPEPLIEKDLHVATNIDSNHNAFILLEDELEYENRPKSCEENNTKNQLDENKNPSLQKQSETKKRSLAEIDPITVPYLSPLVLRKEVENVLEHEGDNCMTKPEFVDQHPIIYWNLVWFFKRIGVTSHLSSLILSSESTTKGKKIPKEWLKADSKNVSVHCVWDNVKLHEDMGQPFYLLWAQQEIGEQSSLVTALLTDEHQASRNVLKQILGRLQCNDLYSPICMLMNERKKGPQRKHHHSIYREILFLSFVAIGRENIDNLSFDLEYRKSYSKLSNKQLSQLHVNDRPPAEGAVFCRRYFKDLELKVE